MLILYVALNCLAPTTGWYEVSYTKLSGTCPEFKSHKQYLDFPNSNECKRGFQLTKSKGPYTATYDGDLTWDEQGANLTGMGKVTVTNWWGGTCQGIYKVSLKALQCSKTTCSLPSTK